MSSLTANGANCRTIDSELDRGARTPSASAMEHIRSCDRCRQLYGWIAEEPPLGESIPVVSAEIRQEILGSLRPVSVQSSPAVLALYFLGAFLTIALAALGMLGAAGVKAMSLSGLLAIGAVLAFGAVAFAFLLAWQMSPGSMHRFHVRVAIVAVCAGFLTVAAALFPWIASDDFWTRGWECLRAGLLMAIPAAVVFGLLARCGYAPLTGMLGATLGAIAGLLGASVLQVACSRQEAAHLLVWHGAVLVVPVVMGIVLLRAVKYVHSIRL